MTDSSSEPEPAGPAESPEPSSPKNQLMALFTLLPVLGILWLVMTYLPRLGDWMGEKGSELVGTASEAVVTKAEATTSSSDGGANRKKSEPTGSSEPAEIAAQAEIPGLKGGLANKESYRDQIVEQLGGKEAAEVRHLAVSDDGEKMVVALKLNKEGEAPQLVEVFFERDEFGRFLSTGDSPIGESLTLWSE